MLCPKCGFVNQDNFINCEKCGHRLSKETLPEVDRNDVTVISDEFRLPETILNNRYTIVKTIGSGGMGQILLAEDTKLKRKVAIKAISSVTMTDAESRLRFRREAETSSQLDHPNICTIFEIASEEDREYIIMQYIDGINLAELMKLSSLTLRQIVDISVQVCDALIEAHTKGIIHRDIKPGNIMIDRNGTVKILDFGLAKPSARDTPREQPSPLSAPLTETGIILGTAPYMSPEQIKGMPLDGRSDIFSFGVVMFELLERQNPFFGKDNIETLYNILHQNVAFKRCKSEKLKAIVQRMLEKDGKKRYSSFSQVKTALLEFRSTEMAVKDAEKLTEKIATGEGAPRPEGQPPSPGRVSEDLSKMVQRWKRLKASTEVLPARRSGWRIALAGGAAVLVALFGFMLLRRQPQPAVAPTVSKTPAFLLLQDFQNRTGDPQLGEKILFLLAESLGQFSEFSVIRDQAVRDKLKFPRDTAVDPSQLQKQLPIRYALSGELTGQGSQVEIKAMFREFPTPKNGNPAPFIILGKDWNSLLTEQVDHLAKRIYARIGDIDLGEVEKLTEFKKISAFYGSSWTAFNDLYRGISHWNRKEFDLARSALARADMAAEPVPAAKYYQALISDYNEIGIEAANQITPLFSLINRFPDPTKEKILALRDKLQFNIAGEISYFQRLKERFPYDKEILYQFGEVFFRHGQAEKAMQQYQAALELDPAYTPALNHLGYCYSYIGRHDQAIDCLEKYAQFDGTANSYDSLGDGYFFQGDYNNVENFKSKALDMDASSVYFSYLTLADTYLLKARPGKALENIAAYDRLVSDKKSKSDAIAKRAFYFYHNREYGKALDEVQKAIANYDSAEINSHSAEYHWVKGLILLSLNRLPEAKVEGEWLRRITDRYRLSAENFNPAYKYFLHLSALLAEKENRSGDADQLFAGLVAMKSQLSYWITYYNYPYFASEYAAYLKRCNRRENCLQQANLALEFNPNFTPALWLQYELYSEMKNGVQTTRILRTLDQIYGSGDEANNYWRNRMQAALRAAKKST